MTGRSDPASREEEEESFLQQCETIPPRAVLRLADLLRPVCPSRRNRKREKKLDGPSFDDNSGSRNYHGRAFGRPKSSHDDDENTKLERAAADRCTKKQVT
jgi:hypothetical protein